MSAAPNAASFWAVAAGSSSVGTTRDSAATSAILKKTNKLPSTNETAYSCQTVKAPTQMAIGTLATAIALPRSHRIITRLRSQRSISAPAGRQNRRYGNERNATATPAAEGDLVRASISRG